jgi:hypothetical protein
MRTIGIEHHDFDSGKASADHRQHFFGVEVGKTAVQEENLPQSPFQLGQCFCSSQCLLYRPATAI